MKGIDKNSPQNKKTEPSSDILLYAFLFILVALLVGGAVWYLWFNNKEAEWNHDYEKALDKKLSSPTADDVSKLIQGNRSRLKTAKRILAGEMRGRKLTDKEKKEVEKDLDNINEDSEKFLQGLKIKDIEKENPALLATIYSDLYEQGKVTVRLKDKTSVNRPMEELRKQEEIQNRWDIPNQEAELIREELDKRIREWYNQAKEELIGTEPGKYPPLNEFVVPLWHKGKKVDELTPEVINEYKIEIPFKDEKGEKKTVDYSKDLEIDFDGYYGFLTKEDKKSSSEGKEVFGLTKSSPITFISDKKHNVELDKETNEPINPVVPSDYYLVKAICNNYRDIRIGFEKRMFFNRLGYEEWLTDVNEKGTRTYFDICFEECLETMAHELAHAIVNTFEGDYDGEEGGGHGKLFYDIMKKIIKMIKNSPDFPNFKTWWEKVEKEQKELAVGSISVKEESHWDKWKYWYISGGVLILAIGVGLVVVFWDTGSKKNAKN